VEAITIVTWVHMVCQALCDLYHSRALGPPIASLSQHEAFREILDHISPFRQALAPAADDEIHFAYLLESLTRSAVSSQLHPEAMADQFYHSSLSAIWPSSIVHKPVDKSAILLQAVEDAFETIRTRNLCDA
jgi:hypothetical protein